MTLTLRRHVRLLLLLSLAVALVSVPAFLLSTAVGCTGAAAVSTAAGSAAAASDQTAVEEGAQAVPVAATMLVSEDSEDHAQAEADVLRSGPATPIALSGASITVEGEGAIVDGSVVTITSPGTYTLAGSLDDGQVIVNVQQDGAVGLVLN